VITVQLNSRLGNQMFQYAAALALADRWQTGVRFDLSLLNLSGTKYELSCFGIEPIAASTSELPIRQGVGVPVWLRRCKSATERIVPTVRKTVLLEQTPFSFQTDFFDYSSKCYLSGYFQNELYFKGIEEKIRREFTIRSELSDRTKALHLKMRNYPTVSIHVRRGDYIENSEYNGFFGSCGLNYYINACEEVRRLVSRPFMVFLSDDVIWVRSSLIPALEEKKLVSNYEVVDWTGSQRPFEDMYLMTCASYNIIANSTFSWWGAWLNPQVHKKVLAPSRWLPKSGASRILPAEWIKIHN
jgi:Glycosyl transferase family 11